MWLKPVWLSKNCSHNNAQNRGKLACILLKCLEQALLDMGLFYEMWFCFLAGSGFPHMVYADNIEQSCTCRTGFGKLSALLLTHSEQKYSRCICSKVKEFQVHMMTGVQCNKDDIQMIFYAFCFFWAQLLFVCLLWKRCEEKEHWKPWLQIIPFLCLPNCNLSRKYIGSNLSGEKTSPNPLPSSRFCSQHGGTLHLRYRPD